jgi:hypothetical protein
MNFRRLIGKPGFVEICRPPKTWWRSMSETDHRKITYPSACPYDFAAGRDACSTMRPRP